MSDKLQIKPEVVGKSKRGNDIYSVNPFLTEFTVRAKKKSITVAKGGMLVDEDGDEVSATTIASIHHVDPEEFVKIYTNNMKAFFDLSKTAIKVLSVLMRAIQRDALGRDEVFFSLGSAKEIYKELTDGEELSKTIYIRGSNELIKKNFIAESPKGAGVFYFNPNLMFNGDRLRFVQEFRKTDSFKDAEKKFLGSTERGHLSAE